MKIAIENCQTLARSSWSTNETIFCKNIGSLMQKIRQNSPIHAATVKAFFS